MVVRVHSECSAAAGSRHFVAYVGFMREDGPAILRARANADSGPRPVKTPIPFREICFSPAAHGSHVRGLAIRPTPSPSMNNATIGWDCELCEVDFGDWTRKKGSIDERPLPLCPAKDRNTNGPMDQLERLVHARFSADHSHRMRPQSA